MELFFCLNDTQILFLPAIGIQRNTDSVILALRWLNFSIGISFPVE